MLNERVKYISEVLEKCYGRHAGEHYADLVRLDNYTIEALWFLVRDFVPRLEDSNE